VLTDKEIYKIIEQGPEVVFNVIKELLYKVELLEKRIQLLESKLNKDSQNSSKPPSTDIFRSNQNNSREKSNKKPGGQPGHEPHKLELSDNADKTIIHRVKRCHNCNNSLENITAVKLERRQILELPEIKIKIEEHQAEVKICPVCKIITKGEFPSELPRQIQYGKGVYTFISACQNLLMLSYERTAEFFDYLFGHKISQGTIKNINERLYNNLEQTELKLKGAIIQSSVINQDETGIYIAGQRHWLHASSSKDLTFYQNNESRGQKAFNTIGIIPKFQGSLIHDYWKPYLGYTNCSHYLCNAHHLRELKFIEEEFPEQSWAKQMRKLLKNAKRQVDKVKSKGKVSLSSYLKKKYEYHYDKIIIRALRANPPNKKRITLRGRIKQTPSRLLLERFRDCKSMILGFIYDFAIPFDNNLVERDIRMMKLKQKISGCFRSKEGADYFCRIRSYISTAKKQGYNIFDAILAAFNGNPLLNF
jgi:transposase